MGVHTAWERVVCSGESVVGRGSSSRSSYSGEGIQGIVLTSRGNVKYSVSH